MNRSECKMIRQQMSNNKEGAGAPVGPPLLRLQCQQARRAGQQAGGEDVVRQQAVVVAAVLDEQRGSLILGNLRLPFGCNGVGVGVEYFQASGYHCDV